MPATGSRCACRRFSFTDRLTAVTVLGVAGLVITFAPHDQGSAQPGDVVSYSEDRLGRPWRIVREFELSRFVIRNGRVYAIADQDEIEPYKGLSDEVTVELAGTCWEDKVREIRRSRNQTLASNRQLLSVVPTVSQE